MNWHCFTLKSPIPSPQGEGLKKFDPIEAYL